MPRRRTLLLQHRETILQSSQATHVFPLSQLNTHHEYSLGPAQWWHPSGCVNSIPNRQSNFTNMPYTCSLSRWRERKTYPGKGAAVTSPPDTSRVGGGLSRRFLQAQFSSCITEPGTSVTHEDALSAPCTMKPPPGEHLPNFRGRDVPIASSPLLSVIVKNVTRRAP